MDYEALQSSVVARLQPFMSVGISAIRLPETEAEKAKNLPTKARFTVIYAGSEYQKATSTAQISQDEDIFIQVLIESSWLYGNMGVLKLASVLKKALTGFMPAGCQRIQVSKHHTIGQPDAEKINNMWNYQVIFQTRSVHVEEYTEDLSVLIKKLTFTDSDGESIIIPPPVE